MTTIIDLNDVESQVQLSPNHNSTSNKNLDGELDGELNKIASNTLSLKNLSPKQIWALLWGNLRSWGSFIDRLVMIVN